MNYPSLLGRKIALWRNDPVAYCYDNFGVDKKIKFELEPFQIEALYSLRDNLNTSLCASKGVGKSMILALGALWFFSCHSEANVFISSKTAENLETGLHKEIALWFRKSIFLQTYFELYGKKVYAKGLKESWFISQITFPRSASPEDKAECFAGKHGVAIAFFIDETGGASQQMMTSAEAIHTSSEVGMSRIMQAGNTSHRSGPLFNASHKLKKDWHVINISGDPANPKRSSRVSKKWAQNLIDTYGRDHRYVQINVLGIFPKFSAENILTSDDLHESFIRPPQGPKDFGGITPRIGLDMARKGEDRTVLVGRRERTLFPFKGWRDINTQDITSEIIEYAMKHFGEGLAYEVFIDGTGGFGGGVYDSLKSLGITAHEIHFSSKAFRPTRFKNIRAEMWHKMGENFVKCSTKKMFDRPTDEDYLQLGREFDAVEIFLDNQEKMQLEAKDIIREKLGHSTDLSDALALTWSRPERMTLRPRTIPTTANNQQQQTIDNVKEYDLYSGL